MDQQHRDDGRQQGDRADERASYRRRAKHVVGAARIARNVPNRDAVTTHIRGRHENGHVGDHVRKLPVFLGSEVARHHGADQEPQQHPHDLVEEQPARVPVRKPAPPPLEGPTRPALLAARTRPDAGH